MNEYRCGLVVAICLVGAAATAWSSEGPVRRMRPHASSVAWRPERPANPRVAPGDTPSDVRLVGAEDPIELGPLSGLAVDGGSSCGSSCGSACGTRHCGRRRHGSLWFRGEYLAWSMDGMVVPPLVTTSPDETPQDVAGVLGEPTTAVLFGGTRLNDDGLSGGLFTLGYGNPCSGGGLEVTYLSLERASTHFGADSDGDPVLARPFFNVETGLGDAQLIALTDLVEGSVGVVARSRFSTLEALLRRPIRRGCGAQWDLLLGYRYGRLKDELLIAQSMLATGGASPGSSTQLFDAFSTSNHFNGFELGTVVTYGRCRWSLELLSKLALGNTSSKVRIQGSTRVTDVAGGEVTRPEGLLARSTNSGAFEDDHFAVIPELGATLGYQLTPRLRATLGYRFVYWSRVARAGDQIDFDLNLSDPLIGAERPRPLLRMTDFWAQGLNVGLDYRF